MIIMAEKKETKKGPPQKGRWKLYEKKGDKFVPKNKSCPKCGQGFLMAQHSDRLYCGGCGYTEFQKKAK